MKEIKTIEECRKVFNEKRECFKMWNKINNLLKHPISDSDKFAVVEGLDDFSEYGKHFEDFLKNKKIKLLCRLSDTECTPFIRIGNKDYFENNWVASMASEILMDFMDEAHTKVHDFLIKNNYSDTSRLLIELGVESI